MGLLDGKEQTREAVVQGLGEGGVGNLRKRVAKGEMEAEREDRPSGHTGDLQRPRANPWGFRGPHSPAVSDRLGL